MSYCWFQTGQTGGQLYSDTSPFSIPYYSQYTGRHILAHFCQTLIAIKQSKIILAKAANFNAMDVVEIDSMSELIL